MSEPCTTFVPQDPNVPHVERERCAIRGPHGASTDKPHSAGLDHRYNVERLHDPAGKHAECGYFVLDPQHDPLARVALTAYAGAAEGEGREGLARDLRAWVRRTSGDAS